MKVRVLSKKAKGLGNLRLALALATVLAASCAASEKRLELAPSATALAGHGAWRDGERDGAWTFFYPSGRRLAAGWYEKGRRVGFWSYWYPDQTPFAEGSYDGQVEGLWVLYEDDGSICADCRSTIVCDSSVLRTQIAGTDHFPWNLFSTEQREELRQDVLPFYAGLWSGSGCYEEGCSVELRERVQEMKAEGQATGAQEPTPGS